MTDDQVKAVITMKKHAVLSTGWSIENIGKEKRDQEIRDFVNYCLTEGMLGSFRKTLLDILSALVYGFSVTEKVYQIFSSGPFKGKAGLKYLKTRPPHSFRFETDKHGNLKALVQLTNEGDLTLPPEKFIIYSYNAEFGNWYGTSDLRAAYRSFFSKDLIIRFWNIYLERFGMPLTVGKYPPGASKDEKEKLKTVLKNIQAKTSMTIPEGFVVELLEAARRGDAGYNLAVEKHNIMIARAVLLPDLLGYSETKGGAYNLGEKHFDLFLWILENLRKDIEETVIDEQLIKPLVNDNYPDVEYYPKFKFNPLTAEDKEALLKVFISAVEKGVVLPTKEDDEYIRQTTGFPKRAQQQNESQVKLKEYKAELKRKPNKYEEKCNFYAIKRSLDEVEGEFVKDGQKIIQKMLDDLTSAIYRRKIIQDKNIKEIEKLDLKFLGDLRLLFKAGLKQVYKLGEKHARAEVKGRKYQEVIEALPPKEALEFFERKAFWIAGVEKEYILKKAKAILYQGLESGKTLKQVMFELEGILGEYLGISPTGEKGVTSRLETIVRTNFTSAYNVGRKNVFQEEDFVEAVMYSAIIDERTTDFCAAQDGRIYRKNDTYLDSICPPNHYNCRSVLVPVTADEEYKIDKHLAIEPAEGFH